MNSIETRGLTKHFGARTAVDHLDLTVNDGEIFALLGQNGAGKTTTIRMLCGLLTPTDGDALVMGKSILSQTADVKRVINVSPQETAVAPNLSVRENLELIAGAYGLSGDEKKQRVKELLDEFDLNSIAAKRAKKLSGGWQRRLSIAMALVSEPKVLFLDEPTLGLDVIARSELWDVIRSLKGRATVILTTHYLEEARELSDRIGVMKDGRLLFVGTADEILKETGESDFEKAFVKLVKEGK